MQRKHVRAATVAILLSITLALTGCPQNAPMDNLATGGTSNTGGQTNAGEMQSGGTIETTGGTSAGSTDAGVDANSMASAGDDGYEPLSGTFPDCVGPEPELLFATPDIDGAFAVDENYLYFSSQDDLRRAPKDGTGSIETLVPGASPVRVQVVGDSIFYVGSLTSGGPFSLASIPKAGGDPTVLRDGSSDLVTDGEALYIYPLDCYTGDVSRVDVDGTITVLEAAAACPHGLRVDDTHAYWIETLDDTTQRAVRVAKTGGTLEVLYEAQEMGITTFVDSTYLYFAAPFGPDASPTDLYYSFVRMPKAGGELEEVFPEAAIYLRTYDSDSDTLYFQNELADGSCFYAIRGGSEIKSFGTTPGQGQRLTMDANYLYVQTSGFGEYPVYRIPR